MVMANKLAGQKAKFVKARANFYGSDDEAVKARAIRLMAEVLAWANEVGVSEAEVTQGGRSS
jgi:L-ribulose-5-phosphate 3-epimerase UlaE